MAKIEKAFTFIFKADEMVRICQGKEKIVITSYIEEVKTQGGVPVGALRVKARGVGKAGVTRKASAATSSGDIDGCPKPPCQ